MESIKKYQIFISSTYKDLIKARESVIKAILDLYHIPIGMEMFSADNDEQWKVISDTINNCDYYLLIIGHRYGSVTKKDISYTEKEYDYAKKKKIPIIAFIRDRDIALKSNERESKKKYQKKLEDFIEKVSAKALVNWWKNEDDLARTVSIAISKLIIKNPQAGWVKANNSQIKEFQEEIELLRKENRRLKSLIKEKKQEPVSSDKLFEDDYIYLFEFNKNNEESRDLINQIYINNQAPADMLDLGRNLPPTCYLILRNERSSVLVKYSKKDNKIKRIEKRPLSGVIPRNATQVILMDAILDKTIKLIVVTGDSASGKTICSIASGLENLLRNKCNKLVMLRVLTNDDIKDVQFYPGSDKIKLEILLAPLYDNFTAIKESYFPNVKEITRINKFLELGQLIISPFSSFRNRLINSGLYLIDDAQKLTKDEVLSVIKKSKSNVKFIFISNFTQIYRTKYINNNGIKYLLNNLKDSNEFVHINLRDSIGGYVDDYRKYLI